MGELDIIARDGATLVFVEVKARASARYGAPLDAITGWKRRRICSMATEYLADRRIHACPCRFDVVSVRMAYGEPPEIEIVAGAFDLTR